MDRAFFRYACTVFLSIAATFASARAEDKKDDPLREETLSLNKLTGNTAMEGRIREMIKNADKTKKMLVAAVKVTKEKPQPLNYNAILVLAKTAHILKQYEQAEAFYKVGIDEAMKVQSASKISQIYDNVIDLFYETKQYDDAIKKCKEFLDIKTERGSELNKVKPFVMEKMIQAMAKKGLIDDAMKLTDNLVEIDGDDGWYFVRLKGDVLREAGKLEESAKVYLETIKRIEKNTDMEKDQRERFIKGMRYTLSGVYVEMKDIDKGAEQMKLLLKTDPDNPIFLNDLGFIWADHDMNMAESEKMIRKAIEESRKNRKKIENLPKEDDHDNPAYLDSLGWVLYKKKEYAEAKKNFLEAIQYEDGKHIEIYDHLADTHLALGETAQAIKVWEDSLKLENVSKRDKERREIIEKKLKKVQEKK